MVSYPYMKKIVVARQRHRKICGSSLVLFIPQILTHIVQYRNIKPAESFFAGNVLKVQKILIFGA